MLSLTTRRVIASRASLVAAARVSGGGSTTTTRQYHENIVEHYENPRNIGSLDKNDSSVGTVSLGYVWYIFLRRVEGQISL